MSMVRTLIVDDEREARDGLHAMLEAEPDIEVVGTSADGTEARQAIRRLQPALVFLDVEMPDLSGFEVLRKMDERLFIIFVTAHEEYALRAFDVHAVDYLMKPFSNRRFQEALARARKRIHDQRISDLNQSLRSLAERLEKKSRPQNHSLYLHRVALQKANCVKLIAIEKVDWIEAADNYVCLHVGQQKHLLRTTLTEMERQLDPAHFLRIHRSRIVNIHRVRELRPLGSGDCRLILHDGTSLVSSRTYSEQRRRVFNLTA